MNIAIPRCFEALLAQVVTSDPSWLVVLLIAAFVAVAALFALMRRGRNRSETEIPPGDPFAAARRDEAEYASANARGSDQTR